MTKQEIQSELQSLNHLERVEAEATLSCHKNMKVREARGELGGIEEALWKKRNRRAWALRLEFQMSVLGNEGFSGEGAILAAHRFNKK
jgi:hypothetical protein